jgi:hypothetical protein
MIWSGLHGDMQSAAEMTAPSPQSESNNDGSSEKKSGCLLERPVDPPVLAAMSAAVKIR